MPHSLIYIIYIYYDIHSTNYCSALLFAVICLHLSLDRKNIPLRSFLDIETLTELFFISFKLYSVRKSY